MKHTHTKNGTRTGAQNTQTASDVLESVGLRVTPQRLAILGILRNAGEPVSIDTIQKKVGTRANYVTLYRVLKQFVESGLVYQTDFREGKAYFEYQESGHHHHHITCTGCGVREATDDCHETADNYAHVTRHTKKFRTIQSHTLEFFGTCVGCAK